MHSLEKRAILFTTTHLKKLVYFALIRKIKEICLVMMISDKAMNVAWIIYVKVISILDLILSLISLEVTFRFLKTQ